ncbi:MAG: hypothetical protein JO148_06125 [Acidimicrobiia bacterium]|nr:hypothetical protein [Acidimicrobiia bacterium]
MRTAFPGNSGDVTLIRVTVVGVVFLSVELLAARVLPSTKEPAVRLRDSWPVDLSLLCASGLLAVGYRQGGVWMALVALLPIVLTRFAFDRYAAADEAYRQTIRALSIVPEVAGVAPMGHGERSAVYAVAMVKALGLGNEAIDRLGTAARLHHIGYVTLDDPEDAKLADNRDLLSRLGGDILRQTEFLSNVGDLVEGVHSGDPRVVTRETAVLRVATEFDLLVLEDPHRAPAALDRLTSDQSEAFGAAAVLALRWALDQDSGLIQRAIATGDPLTAAAAASEAAHG